MRTCEGSCGAAVVPQLPYYCCYSNRAELGTALALFLPLQPLWLVDKSEDVEEVLQREVKQREQES